MGKLSLTGLIIVVVLFLGLSAFIASKITIDGSTASLPYATNSTSLLSAMWDNFINTVGEGLNHVFNPFSW